MPNYEWIKNLQYTMEYYAAQQGSKPEIVLNIAEYCLKTGKQIFKKSN